jgi:DNA-binding MarR family transcriptional regulator
MTENKPRAPRAADGPGESPDQGSVDTPNQGSDESSDQASVDRPMSGLQLDQQVCYSMHLAVRAFDAAYRSLLAEHGLSYPQYIALMTLGEHTELTVRELGDLLHLDSGTLSPLLKRMESAGLVARRRDADDERRVKVTITSGGTALLRQLEHVPATMARRSGLSLDELVALHATLGRVTKRLQSAPA